MTGIARLMSVNYGGYIVAGGSRNPTGKFTLNESYDKVSFSFDFVLNETSMAALGASAAAAQDAWRKPRQDLTITFGGVVRSYKQSDNTGFDADPGINKVGDDWDTGRSRLYRASATLGRPADNLGLEGRRTSNIAVAFDASRRRTVSVTGEYTALGGASATDQYIAKIDAFVAIVLTGLGGTFELVAENYEYIETNKVVQFTVRYLEQLIPDLVEPDAITEQQLMLTVRREAPGDTPFGIVQNAGQRALGGGAAGVIRRLVTVDVNYSASVRADETQNLRSILAKLLPVVAAQVRAALAVTGLALINSDEAADPSGNKITLRQVYRAAVSTGFVEYMRSESTHYETGKTLVPVWDGRLLSRYLYQGPAVATCTITEKGVFFGSYRRDPTNKNGPTPTSSIPGVKTWVLMDVADDSTPRRLGLDAISMTLTDVNRTLTFEGMDSVAAKAALTAAPPV